MKKKTQDKSIFTLQTIALPFACMLILFLQGCSEKIDARQIEEVNGLIYKLNYADPFTGTVSDYKTGGTFLRPDSCVLEVKDGKLHGTTVCKSYEGVKISETQYTDGVKDGLEQFWKSPEGILTFRKGWKNGKNHGVAETFDETTGKKTSLTNWSENQKNGSEKKWDPTGQTLLLSFEWENGRNTGFSKMYGEEKNFKDGLLHGFYRETPSAFPGGREEKNYENGVCVGAVRTWDKNNVLRIEREDCNFTGLMTAGWHRTWHENGRLKEARHYLHVNNQSEENMHFEFDENGKLNYEKCNVDGKDVYSGCSVPRIIFSSSNVSASEPKDTSSSEPEMELCVTGKIDAFRNDHGEEPLINADMLEEWKSECK